MARRRDTYEQGGPEEYEERRVGRRSEQRKGGNEALWIALGAALVVGLVLVLILMGGSGGEQDISGAKAAFEEVLRCCVEDVPEQGAKLVDPREILREDNPNDIKNWSRLTPKRIQELHGQSFRWIRTVVTSELELDSVAEVQTLLRAATMEARANGVDITFAYRNKRWRAFLSPHGVGGAWLLQRLDPIGR